MTYNLKYRDELLSDIADQLRHFQSCDIGMVKVTFSCVGYTDTYEFTLVGALDVLANDLYWDARGSWSEYNLALVETI
jgi:hypothetical protein